MVQPSADLIDAQPWTKFSSVDSSPYTSVGVFWSTSHWFPTQMNEYLLSEIGFFWKGSEITGSEIDASKIVLWVCVCGGGQGWGNIRRILASEITVSEITPSEIDASEIVLWVCVCVGGGGGRMSGRVCVCVCVCVFVESGPHHCEAYG